MLFKTDERFNCYSCKKSDKKQSKVMRLRKAKACFGLEENIVHQDRYTGVNFYQCPANYMSFEVKYYLDMLLKKEKGYKVFDEPIENKSAKLAELFDILDNLLSEFRRKESS